MNNLIAQNESLTMSSRDIAVLLGKTHTNIKISAERLAEKGTIALQGFTFDHNGNDYVGYNLQKRDTLILVAQNCPEFTALIIDRWQELEQQNTQAPALPQNYIEALEHLVTKEKQLIEQAPKVEYFNKVLDTTNGFTTTEIATELNMSAIKLNRTLKEMTVQRKIGGRWVLTAGNLGNEYTTERTHVDEGGKSRHSMLWTEKGRKFILDLFEVVNNAVV